VLAVGLVARIGIAAPRAAIAELRAAVCCATHCPDMPRPSTAPRQCCFVDSAAHDPATQPSGDSIKRPSVAPIALTIAVPPAPPCATPVVTHVFEALRAGPSILRATQKLRC
jgi:hypothetical protein